LIEIWYEMGFELPRAFDPEIDDDDDNDDDI
jgi:hypothetical protein